MEVKHGQEAKLERAEMRMVRWMCGVSLREKTSAELRESMMWFYVTLPIFTGLGRCPIVNWTLLEQ